MWFLLLAMDACRCAPLASCVYYANGSWGCVCPFFGDGVERCDEQRFVTDLTVRAKGDFAPFINQWPNARVHQMSQRQLLGETQYVLELDSTDYEAMTYLTNAINARGWPFEVALLGSATSRVVTQDVVTFGQVPPLLEILDIN